MTDFRTGDYSRKHRYRLRNLHGGGPGPPARYLKPKGQVSAAQAGFVGKEDRCHAIVGHRDCLTAEDGGLGIYLFFKSGRGVASGKVEITAIGGRVMQEGDCELAGWLPIGALDAALNLIRISRLHPGNPNPPPPGPRCSS